MLKVAEEEAADTKLFHECRPDALTCRTDRLSASSCAGVLQSELSLLSLDASQVSVQGARPATTAVSDVPPTHSFQSVSPMTSGPFTRAFHPQRRKTEHEGKKVALGSLTHLSVAPLREGGRPSSCVPATRSQFIRHVARVTLKQFMDESHAIAKKASL